MTNKQRTSYPQQAALEGLEKMKFLMDRGFKQAVLSPQERPDLDFLKRLGFKGPVESLLQSVWKFSPALFSACYSASSMWTANSATVSPSADTQDNKVHFTPANLHTYLHRSLETKQTAFLLKKIFHNPFYFVHHPPLPSLPAFSDEGAANHSRLCSSYAKQGLELFAYGFKGFASIRVSQKFHPRQSKEASKKIALQHKLKPEKMILLEQNPKAVDAGVFHNDVIFTADKNLIFYHELSFTDTEKAIKDIEQKLSPTPLLKIQVKEKDISVKKAVSSYLFNSQLLPIGKDKWLLLAPTECEKDPLVKDYLDSLNESFIQEIQLTPLRQSMQNGGGPACLRLRVVLTEEEAKSIHQDVCLTPQLYEKLKSWIKKHYREKLEPKDLLDPSLIQETQTALDELSRILQLGNIYSFQRV